MHEKQFYHEVVGPTKKLLTRAAENVCVEPEFNDVISLAKQVASATYHFREPKLRQSSTDKVNPMTDPKAEDLRQRLSDVVDSAKHGKLKNPNRTATFEASLAFEYDQKLGFRFLRAEVLVTNKRFGTFEISDTIIEFIPVLAKELKISSSAVEINSQSHPYSEWAETYLAPESGFGLGSVQIRTYQKDVDGLLTLVAPPEIKFRVVEL
jgi:hypothetical protein